MPDFSFCCICATPRATVSACVDDKPEKALRDLDLSCCGRAICARCIYVRSDSPRGMHHADQSEANPRLATYCAFCQKLRLKDEPSSTDATTLLPPPYSVNDPVAFEEVAKCPPLQPPQPSSAESIDPLPLYTAHQAAAVYRPRPTNSANPNNALVQAVGHDSGGPCSRSQDEDVTHYLHLTDTLSSLSLSYKVSLSVLRSHNQIHSDHLLSARRIIKIPRSHYKGASLSPQPVEGEEERERKTRLRRFMVRCKCADYKIASLYLEDHSWDLDKAIGKWWADDQWEKEHPLPNGVNAGIGYR